MKKRLAALALTVVIGVGPGCSALLDGHLEDALPMATGVGEFVALAVGLPVSIACAPISLLGGLPGFLAPGFIVGVPCGIAVGAPFAVIDLLTLPFRHRSERTPAHQHPAPASPASIAQVSTASTAPSAEALEAWPPVDLAPSPQASPEVGPEPIDDPDPLDAIVPCPCCGKPARTEELRCPDCPPEAGPPGTPPAPPGVAEDAPRGGGPPQLRLEAGATGAR